MSGDRRELLSSYQKGDNNKRIFLTLMMIKEKKKWMGETESFGHLSYDSIHIYQFGIKNLTLLIFHISSTCSCFPSKSFCNTVICGLHAMPLYFFFFFTVFICKLLNLNVSHWTHVIIHQKLIFIMQEKKIKIICII